jgi:hypothetical protein
MNDMTLTGLSSLQPVLQKMALHRFQLTEANRPLPKLPDTVTLSNGEECYVKLIVDSVAEALAQIQSIHVRTPNGFQFVFLTEVLTQRNRMMSTSQVRPSVWQ